MGGVSSLHSGEVNLHLGLGCIWRVLGFRRSVEVLGFRVHMGLGFTSSV